MKLLDVITIVFIILKWQNLIDWSWWVVLSPTWVVLILYLVLMGLKYIIEDVQNK